MALTEADQAREYGDRLARVLPLSDGVVLLRAWGRGDIERFETLAGEWDVASNTLWLPHPIGDGNVWLRRAVQRTDAKRFELAICEDEAETNAPGQVVGGISAIFNPVLESVEIEAWVGQPFWRLGIARRACLLMVSACLSGLEAGSLEMAVPLHNVAGRALAESLGLNPVGPVAREVPMRVGMHTVEIYALNRAQVHTRQVRRRPRPDHDEDVCSVADLFAEGKLGMQARLVTASDPVRRNQLRPGLRRLIQTGEKSLPQGADHVSRPLARRATASAKTAASGDAGSAGRPISGQYGGGWASFGWAAPVRRPSR